MKGTPLKDPSNNFQNRFQVYIQGHLVSFSVFFFSPQNYFSSSFIFFFRTGYHASQVHLKLTIVLCMTLNFYAFNLLHLMPIPLPMNPGITSVWPHIDFVLVLLNHIQLRKIPRHLIFIPFKTIKILSWACEFGMWITSLKLPKTQMTVFAWGWWKIVA